MEDSESSSANAMTDRFSSGIRLDLGFPSVTKTNRVRMTWHQMDSEEGKDVSDVKSHHITDFFFSTSPNPPIEEETETFSMNPSSNRISSPSIPSQSDSFNVSLAEDLDVSALIET